MDWDEECEEWMVVVMVVVTMCRRNLRLLSSTHDGVAALAIGSA